MSNKKLDLKQSVRVATHINSISNLSQAPLIIDSITIIKGDRILVKNGASIDGAEPVSDKRNGIYIVRKIVGGFARLVRAFDANQDGEVTASMFTFVEEGASNADTGWVLITNNPIVLDTTELLFVKFSASGEIANDIQKLIDTNSTNIALLAFRQATINSLTLQKMVDGIVDEYGDENNVDNVASINEIFDAVNTLYKTENSQAKLLLNLNGTDGQTTTTDASSVPHTVTFNGNAQLDTASKKFGSASLLLDGTGDYLSIPDSSDWDVFDNVVDDYTIDFHVRHTDHSGNETYISQEENSGNRWRVIHVDGFGPRFQFVSGGVEIFSIGSGEITDSNYHHIAVVKVADEYAIYLDGVQVGYKQTTTTDTFAGALEIGRRGSGVDFFDGNIDDIRVEKSNLFGASPNVGLTDTITVPTSEIISGTVNTTLISETFVAVNQPSGSSPTNARIVLFEQDIDAITLGTDLKAFASRDDGVTYTEVTLANLGEYEAGKNILAGTVDISSQPAGTDMKYKIETANMKSLNLHGIGLSWN